MEGKPNWLPGFPVQIYCNRSDLSETTSFLGLGCSNLHDHGYGHGLQAEMIERKN